VQKLLSILRASAVLAFFISTIQAQGPAPSPLILPVPSASVAPAQPKPPTAETHELNKADLEPFFDGLIPAQLRSRNMAGAVVSVVKDGQLLLAKGYGYADFKNKKPVVADQTLFRPGSISKVFTTIAVMQLVEQGKLDLDRDVNEYLDFAIPKTFVEPVTLRRILTHTGGFEEAVKNLFVPAEPQMKSAHDYLIAAMPDRIFAPGKVSAYSNYGLTIAGYIVQRISGQRFEDYVAEHILKPLHMDQSTFAQPLPATLAPQMSGGYLSADAGAKPFEFVNAAPAGSLTTTATDMSHFMLALLQDGTLEGTSILKPESVHAMESREFKADPALHAIGLVLMEYSTNDQRIFGHGGDSIYFHSDMSLMLDAHVGLFISYNSAGSRFGGGRGEVLRQFLDRYFPEQSPAPPPIDPNIAKMDGHAVSGVYQTSRRGESTLLKVGALLGEFAVRSDHDGVLTIEDEKNVRGELKRFQEIAPLVYREIDGHDLIAFRRDVDGIVRTMFPNVPIYEGQRVAWFDNKNFLLASVGSSVVFLAATVLLWPIAALVRRRYGRPLFTDRLSINLFRAARLVAILQLAVLLAIGILFSRADTDISLLGDGMTPWLHLIHLIGWLSCLGMIVVIGGTMRLWRIGAGPWLRTHATLFTLSGLIFTWFAWHCHLLDASTRF
jgi:CubicO group peptidase (beta-lactamase class C family)